MYPMHWYGIVLNGIPLWSLCEIETSGLDIGCDRCFCLLGVFCSSWSSNIALILFSILSNDLAPPPSLGCSYPEKVRGRSEVCFLGLFHLRSWEEVEWEKIITVIYMTSGIYGGIYIIFLFFMNLFNLQSWRCQVCLLQEDHL